MPDKTALKNELLKQLWGHINGCMTEKWIENEIRQTEADPNGPFADTGAALKRLLALGASRRDLSLLCRNEAYSAIFETLIDVSESNLSLDEIGGLHEWLLTSDPSDLEGRPGSAPPPPPPMPPGGYGD